MLFTSLETCSNIQLLNQVLLNCFKEFDGTVKNRNTYVEDGNIVRWIDNPIGAPVKEVLSKCTEKEVAIWNGYKSFCRSTVHGRI